MHGKSGEEFESRAAFAASGSAVILVVIKSVRDPFGVGMGFVRDPYGVRTGPERGPFGIRFVNYD